MVRTATEIASWKGAESHHRRVVNVFGGSTYGVWLEDRPLTRPSNFTLRPTSPPTSGGEVLGGWINPIGGRCSHAPLLATRSGREVARRPTADGRTRGLFDRPPREPGANPFWGRGSLAMPNSTSLARAAD